MAAYLKAVEVDANFAKAYKNAAVAFEQLGETERAVRAYRKYAQLAPGARDAADALKRALWLEGGRK